MQQVLGQEPLRRHLSNTAGGGSEDIGTGSGGGGGQTKSPAAGPSGMERASVRTKVIVNHHHHPYRGGDAIHPPYGCPRAVLGQPMMTDLGPTQRPALSREPCCVFWAFLTLSPPSSPISRCEAAWVPPHSTSKQASARRIAVSSPSLIAAPLVAVPRWRTFRRWLPATPPSSDCPVAFPSTTCP